VPQNEQQQLASLLHVALHEMVMDVTLIEMLHPELAQEFAQERDHYYAMSFKSRDPVPAP
jgi:hypothetical protein